MADKSNPINQQIETLSSQSNLTTGQLLLWLGQKLNPNTPLYNMVFSFTIQGEIDSGHFRRAFQTLIKCCDILRLTITESDGVPQQRVAPELDYDLPFIDFSTETDPHTASQTWMHKRSTYPLNLENCLFDSALLKLESDQFIWYFNQHHLITDNWSVSLLYRRLQDYYRQSDALTEATELPAYVDYAVSEKNQQSSWQQQAINHWQQKREALPMPVSLYGQTTESATTHTERTYLELGKDRSEALRTLAKTPEARTLSIHQSQFNLFLTLVFAYLHRVSGQTELAIAAPAHNRPTPDLKETPGVFMELFPLQVEIEPEETFTSLLGKVAKESMAFLRYAQPGVSHHGMDRNVNVVLSYINVTFPEFNGMPVHTDWIHSGYGDSQHHLRLEVHDFDATGNFTLQFDFNRDLIPTTQREWASEHFCKLLDAWLEDGQQPIGAVDILAEEERALLVGGVSGQDPSASGNSPSPTPLAHARRAIGEDQDGYSSTLIEQFQRQVALSTDQIAVVFKEQTLTYAELNQQANQLAHYLGRHGIQKGMTVGLFMERSVSMVVSILAVLKAGAAYLPIDPAYPPERTGFMVEDGQVSVVLTQSSLVESCPGNQVICLEDHQAEIAQQPTDSPNVGLTAEDLAYILFTSGSTGKPKGVMVEHRNVLAMLNGYEQTAPAGKQVRGTALCSYGFDVSVWEIFSNLCFGGTIHLVPADVVTGDFARYLITHKITSAYIPPALLSTIIHSLEKSNKEIALDRILVGVEPIQQELLQRYRDRIPQLRIVNGYGPTETTICATFYSFDTVTEPQGIVPIGGAVPGYEVYLVNPQGQQVPVGVRGEIVIGGAGLSRGYLNRPELMAERFIENPFVSGKLYHTGYQARYLTDVNLEFL
ncbi:MAG: amino acid adenylation domain-containing protein [Cyanobacteria bacterium P01_F01_bin.116]